MANAPPGCFCSPATRCRPATIICAAPACVTSTAFTLDDRRFLVATGDSSRFLDRWAINRGRLRFEKRLMRFLGGFTAAARVGDDIYLGTDFSGRPNYLMRLSDRRRFYLPAAAFLQWIVRMEAVAERYLVVLSKELDLLGGRKTICVFDAGSGGFVTDRDFAQRAAHLLGGCADADTAAPPQPSTRG